MCLQQNYFVLRLVRLTWELKGNHKFDENKPVNFDLWKKGNEKKRRKHIKLLHLKESILSDTNGEEPGI